MNTTTAVRVKLTCNHAATLPAELAEVGREVKCDKCSTKDGVLRNRKVKLVREVQPAAEPEAEFHDPAPVKDARRRGAEAAAAELQAAAPAIAEVLEQAETGQVPEPKDHGPDTEAFAAAAELTAEPEGYDVEAASAEWKALKAWNDSGQKGDRPSTANLDAMNEAHAAGKPKPRKANGNGGQGRKAQSPRRAEAEARRTELNNKRGKGRKVTDEELADYIRQVRRDHPDAKMRDEGEYAYWIERIATGTRRWDAIWQSLDGEFTAS